MPRPWCDFHATAAKARVKLLAVLKSNTHQIRIVWLLRINQQSMVAERDLDGAVLNLSGAFR
jgi:hypothetical protein